VTNLLTALGFERQNWLANPNIPVFWVINTLTDMWQYIGYGAIVFMAAITNVHPQLHEAAAMDGANRWQRMWRITFPSILPVIVTMFTLRIGLVFVAGFDKILLLYKPITYETADCIRTYTYRMAFGSQVNYGLAAASGLIQSIVATLLLFVSNALNKAATKTSLF
jgi:ABC-type polysaccharide transport system permease subunit